MLPALTQGTKTVNACSDHERGDCEAETLAILPFAKVALTLTVP
jgi:hypothetical protein